MFKDLSTEEKTDFIKDAENKFAAMDDDEVKMFLCDSLSSGGVDHTCLGLQCDRCPLHDLEDI